MNNALFCAGVCAVIAAYGCATETTNDADTEAAPEHVNADLAPIVGGTKTAAYPAAALLNMRAASGAYYACTAAVIAPKVVLTAGHCVDGMVAWEVVANGSLRTSAKGETYDWKENGATTVNPLHHDLGLVYLDEPIVLPAYPALASGAAASGTAAVDVGRIRDSTVTNEIFSAPIKLRSGATVGFPFDYAAEGVIEHGDSGGPVFLEASQTIVAVNSGLGGSTEVLARVDLLADWLKSRIAARAAVPTPSAGPDAGTPKPDAESPKPDGGMPTPGSEPPKPGGEPPKPGGEPDAGAPRPSPPGAGCESKEVEPNNAIDSASVLKTRACGALGTGDDRDWFTYVAAPGKTLLTVDSTADAAGSFGFLSGGKCTTVLQNARSVALTVTSGSPTLCIGVSSAARKTQPYVVGALR